MFKKIMFKEKFYNLLIKTIDGYETKYKFSTSKIPNKLVDILLSPNNGLASVELKIMLFLCRKINIKSYCFFHSCTYNQLAKGIGHKPPSVWKGIKKLEQLGLIMISKERQGVKKTTFFVLDYFLDNFVEYMKIINDQFYDCWDVDYYQIEEKECIEEKRKWIKNKKGAEK